MILVYGGCLTPCSCSTWRSNWSNSSIYVQPQQQRQQQQSLAICRSSGNVVVILGNVSGRNSCPSTTSNSGFSSLTTTTKTRRRRMTIVVAIAVVVSTATVLLSVMSPNSDAAELITTSSTPSSLSKQQQQRRRQQLSQMEMDETLLDIPQTLSSQDGEYCSSSSSSSSSSSDCKKKPRIQRPKSRKAESCTIKCVTTCIRGSNGGGSPGEGPLNIRRPLVVFKEGFRSRQYCLIECSDICNLINEGDSGP